MMTTRPKKIIPLLASLALCAASFQVTAQEPPPPAAAPTPTAPTAATNTTYRNPVIAGDFADPTIIRVGDTYYAAGTSSEWAPYYPLYTSKDLINWQQIGHVFEKKPDWAAGSFWAPELFHHDGLFYVYYTARRKSDNVSVIAVATTDDPRKGFTDRGIIREWGSEAIDGFVFQDTDSKLYFSWKAYGLAKDRPVALMASEMTADGLHLQGDPFELLQADGQPISAEGQVMTRHGDWYYLIYSSKGCCGRDCDYQLEAARAKNLRGPWEPSPYNPILTGAADGSGDWKCPGHGTMVTLPDQRTFFLYHAYSTRDNVYTGRQGLLDELAWSGDGWPFFASGTFASGSFASGTSSPSTTATVPFPGTRQTSPSPQDFTDRFDSPSRAPQWQWDLLHEPKIAIAPGALHLGVSDSPDPSPAGTFFGLRLQRGDYTLTATLDRSNSGINTTTSNPTTPTNSNNGTPSASAQPGIALYGEAKSALALRVENGSLILWQIKKGQPQQLATAPLPSNSTNSTNSTSGSSGNGSATTAPILHLRMTVRAGHLVRFAASTDGQQWQDLGENEIDAAFIPPWDRAPRAGLIVAGHPGDTATFHSVELHYPHP